MTFIPNSDFLLDVAKGSVSGYERASVSATATGRTQNVESTFWELQGTYTYLSSAQTLYISGTSASDTTQPIIIPGLDTDYNPITGIAVMNGQAQVEVVNIAGGGAITFLRVFGDIVNSSSTNLVGDVYLAETDTLSSGVPDTFSKIKGFIQQGDNIGHTSIFTVKAGFTAFFWRAGFTTHKNDELAIDFFITPTMGADIKPQTINLYQNIQNIDLPWIKFDEKTDIEIRVKPSGANTAVAYLGQFILINNNLL